MDASSLRWTGLYKVIRHWWIILLSVLSLAAGFVVWDRPLPPTWVYTPTSGSVSLIGITKDGRVVTVDSPTDDAKDDRLRVRDIKTGRILSDFAMPDRESLNSEGPIPGLRERDISGDGEIAILANSSFHICMFINLRTGKLVHLPFKWAGSLGGCSPDGRYVALDIDADYDSDNGDDEFNPSSRLFDLKTGQPSWPCEEWTLFSPDSKSFLSYNYIAGKPDVTIRSVLDNSVILSDVMPSIPGGRPAELHEWTGTRLYVTHRISVPGSEIPVAKCWSYDTTGARLSDQRREDLVGSYMVNSRCYAFRSFRKSVRGEQRRHFPPEKDSLHDRILNHLQEWGIPLGNQGVESSWQPLSLADGEPVGERIRGLTHEYKVSHEGDWIVAYDDGLRAWKLPAYRSATRWGYVFLAVATPWGLWWIRRRKNVSQFEISEQPSHCGARF